jgi:hypothetical protein
MDIMPKKLAGQGYDAFFSGDRISIGKTAMFSAESLEIEQT